MVLQIGVYECNYQHEYAIGIRYYLQENIIILYIKYHSLNGLPDNCFEIINVWHSLRFSMHIYIERDFIYIYKTVYAF